MAAPLAVSQPGEHGVPLCVSVQLTPLLLGSFVTVAVNSCVAFTLTFAVPGETDTPTAAITATVAVAETVVLATDVATTVTLGFAGTVDGAV